MALPRLTPHDALLVIDMQIDFITGTLAVTDAEAIIPGINTLASKFDHVILTQDWHPHGHISFASTHGLQPFKDTLELPHGTQRLWPDHCVQGTPGAEIHPALQIPHAELLLRKGFRKDIDSYSAFLENDGQTPTGLTGYLRERELTRLFFCGLAYDFCVGSSAVDGAKLGFECIVLETLTRAVNLPGAVDQMNSRFAENNVTRLTT
jgi:nicotinamidase/pyrazinamidase